MKLSELIKASAAIATIVGCGSFELPGQKSSPESKPVMSKAAAALTGDLAAKGYHLDGTQIKEEDIPKDIRDRVTLFHLALQSEDNPVLGGTIKVLDGNIDDCAVTANGVPKGAPGPETTEVDDAVAVNAAGETPTDVKTNMPTIALPPIPCKEPKVLETFAKNETSNFFSIVIKKSEKIFLSVEADGFGTKSMEIAGKTASFLVLNVNLYKIWNSCPGVLSGGEGGGSEDGSQGKPIAIGAPVMAMQNMPDQCVGVETSTSESSASEGTGVIQPDDATKPGSK